MKLIYYERLKLLQTIFINTINTLNHKYNSFSVSSVYEFEVNRIHWKITKLSEKEYIVDNNFVVFLTDKKYNLNTGALVLLSSTASVNDQVKELPHLDMFDEKQRKEIEANPNGAKYPMAVFKFY